MEFSKDPDTFRKLLGLIELVNVYVKCIWNVVNTMIGYRYDDPIFNTPDYWLLPNEVWKMKYGDCEDTSFILTSAIRSVLINWDVRSAKVFATIGFYKDYDGSIYGHAFVLYSHPKVASGRWLWLESTLDSDVPLAVWYVWNPDMLIPVYFFNDSESYRVDKDYSKLGLAQDYVIKYKDLIDSMVGYVEVGRWLKVKWVHKKVRPVPKEILVRNSFIAGV